MSENNVSSVAAPAAERGHHPDSPSGLQSSDACPHFKNRNTNSAASLAGTLQHKAAETRDLSILEEPEQIDAVKRCLAIEDATTEQLRQAGAISIRIFREQYIAVCRDEAVVDVEGRKWPGITGGYPDTPIVATFEGGAQLAVILDWKFGKVLVTPTKDNLQGKSYALAVFQLFPDVQEVKVMFYHPHVELDDHKPEYSHTFARADMERMELDIRLVLALKHKARREGWGSSVKPKPCANLCLYCQHLDTAECPAVVTLALQVHAKHERLELPAEVRPAYLTDPVSAKRMYQVSKTLEALAKAARKRITDMVLTEGFEIEGMRVTTKSDREISSIVAAREAALEAGITEDQFTECLSLTLGSLEKIVKSKAPRGKGAEAIRQLGDILESHGAIQKGKPYSFLVEAKEDDAIDV